MNIKIFVPLHFSAYSSSMHIKFMFGSSKKEGRRKENFEEFFSRVRVGVYGSRGFWLLEPHCGRQIIIRTSYNIFEKFWQKTRRLFDYCIKSVLNSIKNGNNQQPWTLFLSLKSTQENENKIDIPLSWKFARQCLDRH